MCVAVACITAALGVGSALTACSGSRAPEPSPPLIIATPLATDAGAPPAPLPPDPMPPLDSVTLHSVPEGTYGPYLSTRSDGRALGIWAAQEAGSGRRWFGVPLDPRGAPLRQPRELSEAAQKLGLVALRPTASGFVVLSTALTQAGTGIDALPLGAGGELNAATQSLAHVHEDVLWLDAVTLGDTTSALWATRAPGSASLHLAPLAEPGKPQRGEATLVDGVLAWQALAFGDGIALGCVFGKDSQTPGVRVLYFDSEGRRLAETLVTSSPRVRADLDAAVIGPNLVLAWTEQDGRDTTLFGAAVGASSRRSLPRCSTRAAASASNDWCRHSSRVVTRSWSGSWRARRDPARERCASRGSPARPSSRRRRRACTSTAKATRGSSSSPADAASRRSRAPPPAPRPRRSARARAYRRSSNGPMRSR
jgi:hypothetical protein